ncbi:MAG: hypothetical protein KC776_37055 [Myxococcales bacterium]|nr:hypothetical protein [Myxococcales bacterium]
MRRLAWLVVCCLGMAACGGDDGAGGGTGGSCADCVPDGTLGLIDLSVDLSDPAHFFDAPYPSDLRLGADGHPNLDGFPNPNDIGILSGLLANAKEARGFPVIPVAHFRFTAPIAGRSVEDLVPADKTSPILLVDVDEASPERGRLIPVLAETPAPDIYVPENLLSVAPRPGFVLRPETRYAFVVMASAKDAEGADLAQTPLLRRLRTHTPSGDAEKAADALYTPLWDTLKSADIPADSVANATVFTTGDVVADQYQLSQGVVDEYDPTIEDLAPVDDAEVTEACIVSGTISYPEFQKGTPPFNTEGRFELDGNGLPIEQRTEVAPIKIVLPKTEMPAGGYPLVLNIHGSGGYSIAMVRPVGDDGLPGAPIGPALPYAVRGFATAGSAMPLNPERLPGAAETAYLNVNNLAAMRDTFRQGQIELRLFLKALEKLQIDPAALGSCTGPTLPNGETSFHFDPGQVVVTGQSMGGMYTNMIAAIEPKLRAAVPTGAGGHWTHFIFHTPLQGGNFPKLLGLILATPETLSFLHPVLGIGAAALEPADPIVFVPRIAQRPLPGHPVRPVYEPCAPNDSYFAQETYDAIALAYGHQQAGSEQWPSMQQALALKGLDGLLGFPVEDDLTNEAGEAFTGVVLQFAPQALPGETNADGHAIYSHRNDVKYQYGCFIESFLKTGHARVPAPQDDWTAACQ